MQVLNTMNQKGLAISSNSQIKELINRVNYLPLNIRLPKLRKDEYEEIYNLQKSIFEDYDPEDWGGQSQSEINALEKPISKSMKKDIIDVRYILEEYFESVPQQFRQFILGSELPEIHPSEKLEDKDFVITGRIWIETERAARRFVMFFKLRQQFDFLVDLVDRNIWNEEEKKIEIRRKLSSQEQELIIEQLTSLSFSTRFEIDTEGRIFVNLDEFAQAISGIEFLRVRKCKWEECGKVFWAERTDAKCCSKRCNNNFNVGQTNEKRKADPSKYVFEQLAKATANKVAEREIIKIGFNDLTISIYKKKYRHHPRKIIKDWLVAEYTRLKSRPHNISIPENIIDHLSEFLKLQGTTK